MTPDPSRPAVLWFKRDLRLHDHAALVAASAHRAVLPLYVTEPAYWRLPDISARHWLYFRGAVRDLAGRIEALGGRLCTRTGEMLPVLSDLRDRLGPFDLYAHQETGNAWSYARDEAVRRWCRETGTAFLEPMQFGVWRGKAAVRKNWAKRWDAMMTEEQSPVPEAITWLDAPADRLPEPADLGQPPDGIESLQTPGRDAGLALLASFLTDRGEPYQKAMSSPVSGETACSRLSTHLMAGSLSMREIYQATTARQEEVAALPRGEKGLWAGALRSYVGRLHWHCHFMQKLEAEPELEWRPMARSYEGLRPADADGDRLAAFAEGRTGFPFVDACMRSLRATGWINFRMRAMLMSFASYNLWLPWQRSGEVLARLFTDYEPGIHWTQSQMQSGETGINAVRIYSVVKQGHDQDPTGVFTRRWVPELAHLDGRALQEPWTNGGAPARYPAPIVDLAETTKRAKTLIYGHRRGAEARAEADAVFEKHGSRKPRELRARAPKRKPRADA